MVRYWFSTLVSSSTSMTETRYENVKRLKGQQETQIKKHKHKLVSGWKRSSIIARTSIRYLIMADTSANPA
jgi:hypothetical protein